MTKRNGYSAGASHGALRDCILFAMFGALMFVSKIAMAWAPNIHLLALFITAFTVVYRVRALFPIYVYVLLDGLFGGFAPWWVPYLYVWTVLWAVVMLLPRHMPRRVAIPVYMAVEALFGLAFGTLYAPGQALLYGFSFKTMLAWIAAGLPFDALHAAGNLCVGTLTVPLIRLLQKTEHKSVIP